MPEIYCSPHKRLYVAGNDLEKYRDLSSAFSEGPGHGLLFLDIAGNAFTEESAFAFWKDFARVYISLFAATPDLARRDLSLEDVPAPASGLLFREGDLDAEFPLRVEGRVCVRDRKPRAGEHADPAPADVAFPEDFRDHLERLPVS